MESVAPGERLLRVRTSADGETRLRLEVTDTGQGLDPQSRARLFEPFFTTKPSGLGMGLAICRSIVEVHGGFIRPVEKTGPGTTLLISLPLRRT
jgi:two-component system sensor histidine kinase TtrS